MVKTKMPGWKADENTMPERTLRPGFESPSWCKRNMGLYSKEMMLQLIHTGI